MKNIIAAIALLAATLPALAQEPLDRTQEYRMWAAERMVERLATRMARNITACSQPGGEACKAATINAYPMLQQIRILAAASDDVEWIKIIDLVHEFEAGNEAALNSLKHQ